MMKIRAVAFLFFCAILTAGMTLPIIPAALTIDYGDVSLSGGFQSGHFNDLWKLSWGDIVISFTYDANGLVDDSGAHAWAELGLRAVGYGDFNPTLGSGVWLATDYDGTVDTFDPDPIGAPNLDLDDKLILQQGGGMGEGTYDLPLLPAQYWYNYGFWFDRDGVDPTQALMWGCLDGQTYNTAGFYDVVITLHATGATTGTAYMTVNGVPQGFYNGAWYNGQPALYPAGMTFTFPADAYMQVFYGFFGYGATHSVAFNDIIVTGGSPPVGGEWVPISTVQMLVQIVGSAAVISAIAASFVGFRRIKRKQN